MNLRFVLEILALFVPLFHIMGLLFAAHATLFARTSQGAIAWALSLVFFPYVAVPLYLVFGRRKFHGYVDGERSRDRRINHLASNLVTSLLYASSPLHGEGERFGVFNRLAMVPFLHGNSARLLIDGTQTFDAIFAAIDGAKDHVLVQFFIIREDDLGRKLQARLIEKACLGAGCLRAL